MFRKVLPAFVLCLALSLSAFGGDTNNPGFEPSPTPEPTPETQAQPAPDDSLLDDLVTTFAPYIPVLF